MKVLVILAGLCLTGLALGDEEVSSVTQGYAVRNGTNKIPVDPGDPKNKTDGNKKQEQQSKGKLPSA